MERLNTERLRTSLRTESSSFPIFRVGEEDDPAKEIEDRIIKLCDIMEVKGENIFF